MNAEQLTNLRNLVVRTLEGLLAGEIDMEKAESIIRGTEAVVSLLELEDAIERREFRARQGVGDGG